MFIIRILYHRFIKETLSGPLEIQKKIRYGVKSSVINGGHPLSIIFILKRIKLWGLYKVVFEAIHQLMLLSELRKNVACKRL